MSQTISLPASTTPVDRSIAPLYHLNVNGVDLDVVINEATVEFSEGQHDMATVSCSSPSITDVTPYLDQPCSFLWGTSPNMGLFYGYVMEADVIQQDKARFDFNLSLIGPTYVMQQGQPRFWTNQDAVLALKQMVLGRQLGFYGQPANFQWTSLGQPGNVTDWAEALCLVGTEALFLTNYRGVVCVLDPRYLYANISSLKELLQGSGTTQTANVLIDFTPNPTGASVWDRQGLKVAYFQPSGTVGVLQQSGAYVRYKWASDFPLRTQAEAQHVIDVADKQIQRWENSASARIWGDASIYPGVSVDIVTSTSRTYRDPNSGKWFVLGTSHKMDRKTFQTTLTMARPSNVPSRQYQTFQPFWSGSPVPSMKVVNGQWVSVWVSP
jgi:hypothetical protein